MQSTRSSAGPCAGRRGPVRPRASAGVSAPAPAKVQERTAAPMNLVFVSAEVAPWSKTGGLGDVVGALPIELAARGHHVVSVSPRYDQYAGAWDTGVVVRVLGEDVRFFHEHRKGVHRVFVDHPLFLAKVHGKTGSKLYGPASGADYRDNARRFALFCHAAVALLSAPLPFAPGDGAETVVVANDWHSALVPVLIKASAQPSGKLLRTRTALCVHNVAFQGRFWPDTLALLGVPAASEPAFAFSDGVPQLHTEDAPAGEDGAARVAVAPPGTSFAKINWLRAGALYADKRLTVSPNYAAEVLSGEDKGVELDRVFSSAGGLEGIVNGMDVAEWNPATDAFLPLPYTAATVAAGKAAAKQTLQAEVGLPLEPLAPLFGYVGRLEEQKGVDILLAAIPKVLAAHPTAQFVVLGTGKKSFEAAVAKLAGGRAAGVVAFSEPLAHLITAGSDFLVVPSRFEPCGLIQLHAMRYGTVPVASTTGGLSDTIAEDVTGFLLGPVDADDLVQGDVEALAACAGRAAAAYATPKYAAMSAACVAQDLSWAGPARKWEGVLASMLVGRADAGAAVAARMAAAFAASQVRTPVQGVAQKLGPAAAVAAAAASAAVAAPPPVPKAVAPPRAVPGAPPPAKALVPAAQAAAAGATPKPKFGEQPPAAVASAPKAAPAAAPAAAAPAAAAAAAPAPAAAKVAAAKPAAGGAAAGAVAAAAAPAGGATAAAAPPAAAAGAKPAAAAAAAAAAPAAKPAAKPAAAAAAAAAVAAAAAKPPSAPLPPAAGTQPLAAADVAAAGAKTLAAAQETARVNVAK